MQIRAVIVEDEDDGRAALEMMLRRHCPLVDVVGSAGSFDTGLELVERARPNLLFLDIEMPVGSGFDLLDRLPSFDFETIFTTAYAHYAWRAFRVRALDYLLKPILPAHLVESMQYAGERIAGRLRQKQEGSESLGEQLSVLVDRSVHGSRVALRTAESIEFVQVSDIVRCEAEQSYTIFFLAGGERILMSRNLYEYEAMLSEFRFLRVHNSHLVNVAHIRRYAKGEGGYLIMSDGARILLPRRRRDELLRAITDVLAGKA